MKLNPDQLLGLLEIQKLSRELIVLKAEFARLSSGEPLREVEQERLLLNQQLTTALDALETSDQELHKAEADLKLVENRIARDSAALNNTSSTKDATGLQHELATLAKRKSDLEDIELGIMEHLDSQRAIVSGLQAQREDILARTQAVEAQTRAEAQAVGSEIARTEAQLATIEKSVDAELLELFHLKLKRGPAIGRLHNLTCSACNMGVTSSAAKDIAQTPMDELVTCPVCMAILIRDE